MTQPAQNSGHEPTNKELKDALRWALREGRKGFYSVEEGAGIWYHCRFCHAVQDRPETLKHEDSCPYWHVKRMAV